MPYSKPASSPRWTALSLLLLLTLLAPAAGQVMPPTPAAAPAQPASVQPAADVVLAPKQYPFPFLIYGDVRYTNPSNSGVSDPVRRELLVRRMAEEKPTFVVITGDLVYNGGNASDWKQFDDGMLGFRDAKVPLFPILGNHDMQGNAGVALANYFQRFPQIGGHRWYSLQYGNCYFLMMDSNADQTGGEQWQWLDDRLQRIPADAQFVFVVVHHPPITESTDHPFGGGHSARSQEERLAKLVEQHRKPTAQYLVVSGHVHNYERYDRANVMYIVTGGGGATPYLFNRKADDFYREPGPAYHFCRFTVDQGKLKFEMVKLESKDGQPLWVVKDSFELSAAKPKAPDAVR